MEPISPLRFVKIAPASRGFTLIEMLIVLAIIVIISAIAFSGQTGFNGTVALNNAAYDIALSIRQAQSYGLSSHAIQTSGSVTNGPGYGIAFQSALPTSYLLFADVYPTVAVNAQPDQHPGNGRYDSGTTPPDTVQQTYTLNNGFTIGTFCAGTTCTNASQPLTLLSMTFTRPNTETTITGRVGSSSWISPNPTTACVSVVSPTGVGRYIRIAQTGQVSIASSPACSASNP